MTAPQAFTTANFPITFTLPDDITQGKIIWDKNFDLSDNLVSFDGGTTVQYNPAAYQDAWRKDHETASTFIPDKPVMKMINGVCRLQKYTDWSIQNRAEETYFVIDEVGLRNFTGALTPIYPAAANVSLDNAFALWVEREDGWIFRHDITAWKWNNAAGTSITYGANGGTNYKGFSKVSVAQITSGTSLDWSKSKFYVTSVPAFTASPKLDTHIAPDGRPLSEVYAPDVVTNIAGTYNESNSVTLTWDAPVDMNGGVEDYFTLNHYKVWYKQTDVDGWTLVPGTITTPTATFTLPVNNVEYEITVQAVANQTNPYITNILPYPLASSPKPESIFVTTVDAHNTEGEVTIPTDETAPIDTGIGILPEFPTEPGSPITFPQPVIVVTPPDESGNVCLKDANGNSLLCAKVPAGSNPNAPLTLRRDGDMLFVIYDGRVIITYQIPAAQFPNLVNSKGWISFYRVSTGFPVKVPTGGTYTPPPINGYTYTMFARNLVQPLGYSSRLWRYGWRYESYDVLVDHDYNLIITELSSEDDINAALYAFRGGYEYTIDNVVFSLLIDNGYSHWITGTN